MAKKKSKQKKNWAQELISLIAFTGGAITICLIAVAALIGGVTLFALFFCAIEQDPTILIPLVPLVGIFGGAMAEECL